MSKITRRSYKRKKIIMGAGLFGAIGLVSTGFAAWVLSAPATTQANSSLSVGMVSDKNMQFQNVKIENTINPSLGNVFSFEPAQGDNAGRVRWDGSNYESLSLTVTGNLTHVQNLGKIEAKITVDENPAGTTADHTYSARTAEEAKEALDSAISKGYVVAPTAYKATETLLWTEGESTPETYDGFVGNITGESDETMAFSYAVAFSWGSTFGGTNPSLYFDAAGASIPQGDAESAAGSNTVAGMLKEMHDLLDGIKLVLTLTASPNN